MYEHHVNICWQRDERPGNGFLPSIATGNHADFVRETLLGKKCAYRFNVTGRGSHDDEINTSRGRQHTDCIDKNGNTGNLA
jgi:hypothetical protein